MKIDPKKIRTARTKAGLTQTEAAKLIGGAMRSWQDWESGARNMPVAKWELFLIKLQGLKS